MQRGVECKEEYSPIHWEGSWESLAPARKLTNEVFKITHNIYDPEVSLELRYYPKSNTRGNKYKLLNHTFHYDTRKCSFSARIVNIWNSLPNFVVDVDTVCLFKTRLDKFWMHQDVMYDFAET